jgi:hypothetical protein
MRRFLLTACLLSLPALAHAADRAAYLPADTDAVVTIQVKDVAESELGKKLGSDLLKQLISISKPAEAAVSATGLDLLKDFDHIMVGIDLDKTDPPRPFALLEGKFDVKKIDESVAAYMKEHPNKVEAIMIGEKPAYKIAGSKSTDVMFATFLDGTKLVVASSEKDITGAFEAAAGTRKPVISKELTNLLTTSKSTAPIFARAWVKGKLNELKVPGEKLQAKVRSVEWVTAQVVVAKDVFMVLTLSAPDEPTAQAVSDLLGAGVGVMRLQILAAAEDQPELKPISELLRSTRVQPHGKTVVATGTIKGDSLEKALHASKAEPKK